MEIPFNQKQVPSIPVVNSTEEGTVYILLLENKFTRKNICFGCQDKVSFLCWLGTS